MQGWVKLHRKLLDNPIMKEPELLQLFIYCLLRANHEPAFAFWGKEQIKVDKGQFITGRFELSNDLKQKPTTTYKRMLKLEKLNYLNIKSNNKNSLVTIVNWDLYQSINEECNTKSNNKVTTKEQQSNTDKNIKNDKNEKKKDHQVRYFENDILNQTLKEFIKMRTTLKRPLTEHAINLLIKKLNGLASTDPEKVAILNQSIENSWQGIFPLKVTGKDNHRKIPIQDTIDYTK